MVKEQPFEGIQKYPNKINPQLTCNRDVHKVLIRTQIKEPTKEESNTVLHMMNVWMENKPYLKKLMAIGTSIFVAALPKIRIWT